MDHQETATATSEDQQLLEIRAAAQRPQVEALKEDARLFLAKLKGEYKKMVDTPADKTNSAEFYSDKVKAACCLMSDRLCHSQEGLFIAPGGDPTTGGDDEDKSRTRPTPVLAWLAADREWGDLVLDSNTAAVVQSTYNYEFHKVVRDALQGNASYPLPADAIAHKKIIREYLLDRRSVDSSFYLKFDARDEDAVDDPAVSTRFKLGGEVFEIRYRDPADPEQGKHLVRLACNERDYYLRRDSGPAIAQLDGFDGSQPEDDKFWAKWKDDPRRVAMLEFLSQWHPTFAEVADGNPVGAGKGVESRTGNWLLDDKLFHISCGYAVVDLIPLGFATGEQGTGKSTFWFILDRGTARRDAQGKLVGQLFNATLDGDTFLLSPGEGNIRLLQKRKKLRTARCVIATEAGDDKSFKPSATPIIATGFILSFCTGDSIETGGMREVSINEPCRSVGIQCANATFKSLRANEALDVRLRVYPHLTKFRGNKAKHASRTSLAKVFREQHAAAYLLEQLWFIKSLVEDHHSVCPPQSAMLREYIEQVRRESRTPLNDFIKENFTAIAAAAENAATKCAPALDPANYGEGAKKLAADGSPNPNFQHANAKRRPVLFLGGDAPDPALGIKPHVHDPNENRVDRQKHRRGVHLALDCNFPNRDDAKGWHDTQVKNACNEAAMVFGRLASHVHDIELIRNFCRNYSKQDDFLDRFRFCYRREVGGPIERDEAWDLLNTAEQQLVQDTYDDSPDPDGNGGGSGQPAAGGKPPVTAAGKQPAEAVRKQLDAVVGEISQTAQQDVARIVKAYKRGCRIAAAIEDSEVRDSSLATLANVAGLRGLPARRLQELQDEALAD